MSQRTVKDPVTRKNELLDCAQKLFLEHGYERVTMRDLMAEAGISKGGLYHHFESKEELLEAMASRFAERTILRAEGVLNTPELNAIERLNGFLSVSRRMRVKDAPTLLTTFHAALQPENALLYQRIITATTAVTVPVVENIVKEGQQAGLFDFPDARTAAELILQLSANTHKTATEAVAALNTQGEEKAVMQLEEKIRLNGIAIDRILGLPDGTIQCVEPGFAAAVFRSGISRRQ
ncbi:TetR/AcrR family transcriptional regulator [Halomonas daqingensis]|uniref:TetR/AcrR family transcriptional regulator n=1 Tax=Billgrantia desiderata TaxID=52021 RepID=UPI000A374DFB|nr:TetR/AcrR family transcriptional regulator [Halomonas desiderata]MCE8030084.1 TetR/AcrR family transcriptional regulator [Halomonas desiderata]OUE38703.1 hypothetical protein BZY95_17725 [Halomonas desiderata SP1]